MLTPDLMTGIVVVVVVLVVEGGGVITTVIGAGVTDSRVGSG